MPSFQNLEVFQLQFQLHEDNWLVELRVQYKYLLPLLFQLLQRHLQSDQQCKSQFFNCRKIHQWDIVLYISALIF